MDDEFQSGGRQPSPGGLLSSAAAGPSGTTWAQLGTFEQTRKENVQQAGAWAGRLSCCSSIYDSLHTKGHHLSNTGMLNAACAHVLP